MRQLAGYVVLGGSQTSLSLPTIDETFKGGLGSTVRGRWVIESSLEGETLNIPARGKSVQLLYPPLSDSGQPWQDRDKVRRARFADAIAQIDSSYEGLNYRAKLNTVLETVNGNRMFGASFLGAVLNLSVSTHASIALLSSVTPIYVWGLHDQQLESSYLVWSTDERHLLEMLAAEPLRFLVYRFPILKDASMFIQLETVCAKWYRWNQNHKSVLHAFNALEWRLYGGLT
jgi:hypothetical protein